jgi:hypothetical protein
MKPISPAFFLLLFSFVVSCNGNVKPSLIGKWKVTAVDKKFIEYTAMNDSEVSKMIEKATVEFTKDGKVISILPPDIKLNTYTYDEQQNKLTMTVADKDARIFSIKLEKDKLEMNDGNGTVSLKRE